MFDYLRQPQLKIKQNDRYKMSSDTHHLALFMEIRAKDTVLDIGTNNGVLALAAAVQTKEKVIGIDIDKTAIELAQENAKLNEIENVHFVTQSFQEFESKAVDVIVSNPPYHKDKRFKTDVMQFDDKLSLEDLALHAYRLLKDKGRMYLVIKAYRMHETALIFHEKRFALRRIQMVHHSLKHQASVCCMEFRKEGKEHLVIEAPIINDLGEFKK